MKKLKKIIPALVLTLGLAVGLSACSGGGNDLAKIEENKKVVMGVSADYPPFEFVDKDKSYVGLDFDVAKEIAKDLGVELEVNDMQYDTLITALNAGKVDIILSGMNPTPEREESVDFSDIYHESKHFVVINKANEGKITKEADLKNKKIGVQMGSTQEALVKETFKDADIQSLPAIPELMLMLENNKVDAVVTEDAVSENYVSNNAEKLALSGIEYDDGETGVAVAMRKDNEELKNKINETIARLKKEGKIEEYYLNAIKLSGELAESSN